MEKRNIIFITGDVITYDLSRSERNFYLERLSKCSTYSKVADNVYKVENLEELELLYDSFSSSPFDRRNISPINFFVGKVVLNATIKAVDDDVLFKCFENFSTIFSCSRITDSVYKVTEL